MTDSAKRTQMYISQSENTQNENPDLQTNSNAINRIGAISTVQAAQKTSEKKILLLYEVGVVIS